MSRRLAAATISLVLFAAPGVLVACGDDTSAPTDGASDPLDLPTTQAVSDTPEARAVAERGEPEVPAVDGAVTELKVTDDVVGTGAEAVAGGAVTAQYVGAVASTGEVFSSSWKEGGPVPFSLDGVIPGWSQGIPGMKAGGRRTLVIPAALAYGPNPPPGSGIPPNADLVFVVDLVAVDG